MSSAKWAVAVAAALAAGSALATADGAAVYAKSCKACHGATGKGNPALAKGLKVTAADLDLTTPAAAKAADTDLTDAVTKGKEKMKPVPNLTPEQVTAVVAYVRTLQSGKAAAGGAAPAGGPAATYAKTCKLCHGVAGEGNPKMANTSLIGDDTAKKSDDDLIKVTTDGSANKKMPAYGKKLSADEIKGLVAYLRTLKK